jgi:hypothetical protein
LFLLCVKGGHEAAAELIRAAALGMAIRELFRFSARPV